MADIVWNEPTDETPWPNNAQLFQPLELEQILLPDNANCLYIQTFLRMCDLDFEIIYRSNAEFMSPSGKVPFLKCGPYICEADSIVNFVGNKGYALSKDLDPSNKADLRAFTSLVNSVLVFAELYITWCESSVYNEVTRPRYGSGYPWPLNTVLTYKKRKQVIKMLKPHGFYDMSINEVYKKVETCCQCLSTKLDNNNYFFGEQATEFDALVFGHVYTILTTPLPTNKFSAIVRGFPNIVAHCERIEKTYYPSDKSRK
ncbi:metaxin-2 [Nilaparvata lugens]|uniref:metaxin-2 n=1 Tax=Nilaparvata lugens TaxID=108931 RepID=UPI00193D392D|nr:metaxin-2 [Nilaparvata lugens]